MTSYSLQHESAQALRTGMVAGFTCERSNGARLLAYIAEFDQRRAWREAGYNCMSAYLVGEFNISDESAYKRTNAARVAYQYPLLFEAVADGRLHLSAIILLGPRIAPGNVDHLVAIASHQTCEEIRRLLAESFPQPGVPTSIQPMLAASPLDS